MDIELKREQEWKKSQELNISFDLVAAAKRQLQFLAEVDRNRFLYDANALHKAIYRYNACWLPLLDRHSNSPFFEGPLVVPLDCEWVWHCHRLNPVRYKSDCEELYGKILDNRNVVSSIQGTSMMDTKEAWAVLCPNDPYEVDYTTGVDDDYAERITGLEKYIRYDLLSAIQRQAPFYYQVSRPHVNTDLYLEGAVARYKGFLNLIKSVKERSIETFSVPTYDIDLIWHTHQLHPVSYCKDLLNIMGNVLGHDDTDSDRTKGKKLDVGFSETTKNFEEMYGRRYWRAGAMYRGSAPLPLRSSPYVFSSEIKDISSDEDKNIVHLRESKVIEVMLEFVSVKYLQDEHKGSVYVSFSKTQPDSIFNVKRKLTIFSESGEKQVASFQCEPTGCVLIELISHPPSSNPLLKTSRTLGSCSISVEDILLPESGLMIEKWLELTDSTNSKTSKPITLRVAMSATLPTPAPFVLHMFRNRLLSRSSCFFPLPGRQQNSKNWTRVVDQDDNEIITLQMRESKKTNGERNFVPKKCVVGILKTGEECNLAERVGTDWSFRSSHWSLPVIKNTANDSHILIGQHIVKFYAGRNLEYEHKHKHCKIHGEDLKHEKQFITAVEYSAEEPYGRAVALLNLSSGTITVKDKWILLPSIVVAYMLGEILRKEGYDSVMDFLNLFKDKGTPIPEV